MHTLTHNWQTRKQSKTHRITTKTTTGIQQRENAKLLLQLQLLLPHTTIEQQTKEKQTEQYTTKNKQTTYINHMAGNV